MTQPPTPPPSGRAASCKELPADHEQLEMDELMFGSSFKLQCLECKCYHRVHPERVVLAGGSFFILDEPLQPPGEISVYQNGKPLGKIVNVTFNKV